MADEKVFPEDWTEDDIKQYKDITSSILAGMEQVRKGLDISWTELGWPRMKELAERLAAVGYDFTVFDSYLLGTYLLSSARSQVRNAEAATHHPEPGA